MRNCEYASSGRGSAAAMIVIWIVLIGVVFGSIVLKPDEGGIWTPEETPLSGVEGTDR